jgi:hypothetical protein
MESEMSYLEMTFIRVFRTLMIISIIVFIGVTQYFMHLT